MNYHTEEGPVIQEWVRPKRKVCSQCKWCNENRLYTQRSSNIQFASCQHPEGGSDLDKLMRQKYAGSMLGDAYLDHDRTTVFTPDWCPIDKTQPTNP